MVVYCMSEGLELPRSQLSHPIERISSGIMIDTVLVERMIRASLPNHSILIELRVVMDLEFGKRRGNS